MNRPAGEPSIEDILASLRQEMADELDDLAPIEARAEPPPPPRAVARTTHAPLLERLSGVMRQSGLSAAGVKRPSPIDDDLADLLDDEPETKAPLPSRPSISLSPETQKPRDAVVPPLPPAPPPFMPPPPFAATLEPAVPPVPPASASPDDGQLAVPPDLPPLRKPGFFPPPLSQGGAGAAAATVSPAAVSLGALPPASAVGGDGASNSGLEQEIDAPQTIEEALKILHGRSSAAGPGEPFAATSSFDASGFGAAPAAMAEVPAAAALAVDEAMPAGADLGEVAAASDGLGFALSDPVAIVAAPELPVIDQAVASSALDALALGLAAAAGAKPAVDVPPTADVAVPVSAEAPQTVVPPDAVAADLAAGAAAQSSAAVDAPAAAAPSGPVTQRTLEDAVADMLKPMLQQWLADHMPRILEKALREEIGKGNGGGSAGA